MRAGRAGGGRTSRPDTRRRRSVGGTVLVAHPSPDMYGSDRVALSTVQALVERGARVVVTMPGDGPLTGALEDAGAEVVVCPSPVLRKRALRPGGLVSLVEATIRSVGPGLRLLRRERPGVVYVSTLTIPLWLALARLTGRPVVCHVHEAESGVPRFLRRALAIPLVLCSSIVVNSEFTREVLVSGLAMLRGRSRVVPNPVPGPPAVEPPRERLGDTVDILYVGRLSPRKGPDVALGAVAELRTRGVEVRLRLLGSVFAGYEWFEDQLRTQVAREGLGDRVSFLGFRADVWSEVAAADVVVVPSTADEPFGNTAVEAVLGARPVVVSAVGGLPEAVAGLDSAQVVPPGDPAAVADAIEKVVANWPERRTAALADAAVAARRHDPALYADRLDAVLDDAVAGGRVAAGRPA